MIATLFLLAASLPQFCFTWVDKFNSETSCQTATVLKIREHVFKIVPPTKRPGAVGCRVYRDRHIIGTLTTPTGSQCDGFILNGLVLKDGEKAEFVLANEAKLSK